MAKYTDHSKFIYQNYDDIQDGINSGAINAWDVILCKDTKEMLLIKDDLSVFPIKSKVYRFLNVESAEQALNQASDSYPGQIVSIIYNHEYTGYIVNQNALGRFYVTPLSIYSGQVNYDTLGNRPVENLTGSLDAPVIVSQLTTGTYKIHGQFCLTDRAETIYISVSSNVFLVRQEDDAAYVKKISASDICDYIIDRDGRITHSVVPTTEWLKAQGYVTESYVDAKVAALDFITKQEIEEYVNSIVLQAIGSMVSEQVSKEFGERFQPVSEKELLDVFTDIFNH